jgi:hypothetical protein
MTYNLQTSYPDVSVLTTNDKAISVIYGRAPDGDIIPIQIDNSGVVATSGGGGGGGSTPPSSNSFYIDQSAGALTGTYTHYVFGFTSVSISVTNDDPSQIVQFSFDGTHLHGTVLPEEAISMDWRGQPGIWIKATGTPGNYRLWSY